MGEDLFSGFDTDSAAAWKARIERDLKGRDYDQALRWTSPEGIITEPFYTSEDLEQLRKKYPEIPPAAANGSAATSWKILEKIDVDDPAAANRMALEALSSGAEGIVFDLNHQGLTADVVTQLTEGVYLDAAPVSVQNYSDVQPAVVELKLPILQDDILLQALRHGRYQPQLLETALADSPAGESGFHLAINGAALGAAGADMAMELGYALAIAQEYLHTWPHEQAPRCHVSLSTGSDFFGDVARFRAFRQLWIALTGQYPWEPLPVYLRATGTSVYKSLLDPHTNLLRSTSEGMAAAIGGADAIVLSSFDLTGTQDREGRRWARNISLLLRHEAHLSNTADPARGSFYLEALTTQLAEQAWKVFQETEAGGGFISAWRNGSVIRAIDASKAAAWEALAHREITLVGVNNYPSASDPLTTVPEWDDGLDPLAPFRLAEGFERLRARTNNYVQMGHATPVALLVGSGAPAMQKARMNFSSNLLGCAGMICEETDLDTFNEQPSTAPDLVVLCSDDASWPEAIEVLRRSTERPIVLAGNPESLGSDHQAAINFAIHKGCNVYRILSDLQQEIFS